MNDLIMPAAENFSMQITTFGPDQTQQFGRQVARLLTGGEIVLLHGPLGAGKTCFVQGVCAELGIATEVVSPTFTLVNTYPGQINIHHLDFYRIESGDSLDDIGVPEILEEVWDKSATLFAEWPKPLLQELGPTDSKIELLVLPAENPDERNWFVRGVPSLPDCWHKLFAELDLN